jgi:hypothetical protein
MSIHLISTTATYRVDDSSEVTLQITIGEAQGGGWVVAWDADTIVAKGSGTDPVRVGAGRDVKGRVLQVVVTAVDIRPETNRLSRTLALGGGVDGARQLVDRWDDGSDGDAAVFTTMIGFL